MTGWATAQAASDIDDVSETVCPVSILFMYPPYHADARGVAHQSHIIVEHDETHIA